MNRPDPADVGGLRPTRGGWEIRLTLTQVGAKVILAWLLAIVALVGTAVTHVSPEGSLLYKIGSRLNLGAEGNLGAWFSSMLLFGISAAALACLAADRANGRNGLIGKAGWIGVSGLFGALSLDELGSLHERFIDFSRLDQLTFWLVGFAIAIPGFLSLFSVIRLRHRPESLILLLLGVTVLCTIPLLEFLEVRTGEATRSVTSLVAEEGLELLGMLFVLAALLAYLRGSRGLVIQTSRRVDLIWLGAAILVATGLALLQSTALAPPGEVLGNVDNWMPAVAAMSVSIIAWLRRADSADRTKAVSWLQVSGLALLLSAYVGGNQYAAGANQLLHWVLVFAVQLAAAIVLVPLVLRRTGEKRLAPIVAWLLVLLGAVVPNWAVPMTMLLASLAIGWSVTSEVEAANELRLAPGSLGS